MGLKEDREMAAELQGDVPLILGGHSHNLLPDGEWVGDVLVAQAGQYAEHLGRVELDWDGRRLQPIAASVIPVVETIPPSVQVQSVVGQVETEVQELLDEVICHLPEPPDYAIDRECGIGNLLVDALRERAHADIAVAVPGPQFIGGLFAGPLRRETLWSTCPSTGNPGVIELTGAQLTALVSRGLDLEFAADKHPAMRGQARGLIHISGARVLSGQLIVQGKPIEPERNFLVAASDFELEPFWSYTEESWQLKPNYEVDVILREVVDDYLCARESVSVEMGRLGL
jgi:2',3'-cyclic-nucleotide 2'-phosphodiesterase (5'-nucleotidase family)